MPKWKCYRCGQVYEQDIPPDNCSNCNAQVSFWIDWTEAKSPLDDPVSKYMDKEFVTVDLNSNAWDAAILMKERKIGSVVVTQEGKPVGMVTERDMLYKVMAEDLPIAHVLLRKIMSSPLVSVAEDTTVRKAISMMEDKGFRRLLVERSGSAVGMVTHYDLVNKALKASPAV